MKKSYLALFLIALFLFGCVKQQILEKPSEEAAEDISQTTDISEAGKMDEELDVKSLETLEEDLKLIENI